MLEIGDATQGSLYENPSETSGIAGFSDIGPIRRLLDFFGLVFATIPVT